MTESQVLMALEDEMEKHELLDQGWTYGLDEQRTQYGVCSHTRRLILISRHLAARNSEAKTLDTIRHEIAHALVGEGHGHDEVWRLKAIEIGSSGEATYGCEVARPPMRGKIPDASFVIHLPYRP